MPSASRSRARSIRFTFALSFAILLAGMLVYTTFSAASPERFPKQLVSEWTPEQTYRVGGQVLADSVSRKNGVLRFKMGHPGTGNGPHIEIEYEGTVPDPFREGRDVIVDVQRDPSAPAGQHRYIGQGNSLITKCPSKFNGEPMNPGGRPAAATKTTSN